MQNETHSKTPGNQIGNLLRPVPVGVYSPIGWVGRKDEVFLNPIGGISNSLEPVGKKVESFGDLLVWVELLPRLFEAIEDCSR